MLPGGTQLGIGHAAVEVVLSFKHEIERARGVPGQGTALKRWKLILGAFFAVDTAIGAVRISTTWERSLSCPATPRTGLRRSTSGACSFLRGVEVPGREHRRRPRFGRISRSHATTSRG
jgi:hypothetical protein